MKAEDKYHPPTWPIRFFRWFCRPEIVEDIEGDLVERFHEQVKIYGRRSANAKFTIQILKLIRPGIVRPLFNSNIENYHTMFRHNLLIAFRNARRDRLTFLVNLIGLATALACAFFIYLWVSDELKYDKFHESETRLYQALLNRHYTSEITTTEATPGPLAEALVEEVPEIEYAVATTAGMGVRRFSLTSAEENMKAVGLYVGRDFFRMFTYNMIAGSPEQALTDPGSIVISESLAKNLFATTDDAFGSSIELEHSNTFLVTGIFRDVPSNSSDQFDFVLPFEVLKGQFTGLSQWNNADPRTYVLLHEGANVDEVNEKIKGLLKEKDQNSNADLFLRAYSDKYLYNHFENGIQSGGRISSVRLFIAIAIFVLLIASINFMNLSTAKAYQRLKEVGIKKTIGANRRMLVVQYFVEACFIAFSSLLVATLIVFLCFSNFNLMTGKELSMSFTAGNIFTFFAITLFTGLLAGSYPAFYLSSIKPISTLKGKIQNSLGAKYARKGLVVFQFSASMILIVSVLVINQQMKYTQQKDLGYKKDNVIYFPKEGRVNDNLRSFLAEVKSIPGILNASSAAHTFVGGQLNTQDLQWDGKNVDQVYSFETAIVDYDLIETMDIQMAEGRSFSKDYTADDSKIIFNEAAIDIMELTDPLDKRVKLWGQDRQIIGVAENFHFQSFYEEVRPLFFLLNPKEKETDKIFAKIQAGKEREVIERLGAFYQEYNPGFSFEYKFLDEEYQAQYIDEQRISKLTGYFAWLAVLISCLGLFGLITFATEQRKKEIGIRKVLGASVTSVVSLLSRDFMKLLIISIVAATPISWYLMRNWLMDFVYKISLEWWMFAVPAIMVMTIAMITVSAKSIRAALSGPISSIRDAQA